MTYDEIVIKMMSDLTEEEAINLAETKWWEVTGLAKAAWLQLHQRLLCIPFDKFREATEFLLGRGVFSHEFVDTDKLINEVLTGKSPTLTEIMDLIPHDKLFIFQIDEKEGDDNG